jgi:hypothetical protein
MRSALFVAVGLLTACKGEPFRPDAGPIDELDAYKPPWFYPAPGEVKDWDIQLAAPYNLVARPMVIVNIWDITPATTIDYGGGVTTTVPAGSQNGMLATLKAGGKVICHVGTGAINLNDPDATKFPGYEATPPDRPTAPGATSAIGWSTPAGAMERFVDFRNPTAAMLLLARVQLAKNIGCDGILAYRNDAAAFTEPTNTHGFAAITSMQQTTWIERVAKQGHDLMISVGGRGGHAEANIGEIDDDYDFLVAERCTEIPNCELARPFIEARHAVFGLDYNTDDSGAAQTIEQLCPDWVNGMVDGVMKSVALDSSVRVTCP